mmetsp:Transcript_17113/g.25397  ORF Transcript_17113/g.25397 Transcript_17113/m.25397 type:complete len:96 (+) Transcript_17113:1037-1324(+)
MVSLLDPFNILLLRDLRISMHNIRVQDSQSLWVVRAITSKLTAESCCAITPASRHESVSDDASSLLLFVANRIVFPPVCRLSTDSTVNVVEKTLR